MLSLAFNKNDDNIDGDDDLDDKNDLGVTNDNSDLNKKKKSLKATIRFI